MTLCRVVRWTLQNADCSCVTPAPLGAAEPLKTSSSWCLGAPSADSAAGSVVHSGASAVAGTRSSCRWVYVWSGLVSLLGVISEQELRVNSFLTC